MMQQEIVLSVIITPWCHNTKMTHQPHRHLRGDGDEAGESFNSSTLSFKTVTEISLSNGLDTFRQWATTPL